MDLGEDLVSLVCLVLNAIALVRCRKSENLDAMNGGVVGVFIAPTTKSGRWEAVCRMAHRTVYRTCPVHHRTIRWPRRQKLQRSESNGLVTWQAHRIVSGGAPDCPVRHTTTAFTKRLVWWLGL